MNGVFGGAQWQFEDEFRAFADDAFHTDASMVLFDDLAAHAQTEAAAAMTLVIGLFGSIKRLKDKSKLIGRNADAGVADADFGHLGVRILAHLDGKSPSARHRLASVDEQI